MIENGVEKVQLLPAMNDKYGGVIVELKEQHLDSNVFLIRLRASMSLWKLQVLFVYTKLLIKNFIIC